MPVQHLTHLKEKFYTETTATQNRPVQRKKDRRNKCSSCTWSDHPSAVQILSVRIVAICEPARHFVKNVRHTPPQFTARLNARVAVPAAPTLVALAEAVARAPGRQQ
jgi:hypothetical protein